MAPPFPSPTQNWHTTTYDSLSPTRPELSAKGKSIVVTGGGTGIGAETARYFAAAGASRIALLGRREKPLLDTKASIEAKYPSVEVFAASTDIKKKEDVDSAFKNFTQDGKHKIDVLISGAAMIGPQVPIKDVDTEKYLSSIDTNIHGTIHVGQAFLKYAAAESVVIDINSSAAHVNFAPGISAYTVSKMAVVKFWDFLAFENEGVRVHHVQPGVIDTDMNKEAGGIELLGFSDDISLPASFSVWLASPEAKFLDQKFLWVNWDVEELKAQAKEIEGTQRLGIGLDGWPFAEMKQA